MKIFINHRTIALLIIISFIVICFIPTSMTQDVKQNYKGNLKTINGQILFSPIYSKKQYIIDYNGIVNHTWVNKYTPGQAVYMYDNNSILYTTRLVYNAPGGAGGGIQKIMWDGSIAWEFTYYTDEYLSHHDIELLPNGNILMIAWEYKTRDEAIAAGRNPELLDKDILMPDHIIEVEPILPEGGNIVWEWHVWDHLIQDFDPLKDNYGTVEDHPELIDINYGVIISDDWNHINSIDYNEELDQIILSCCSFSEIWVIDHSTTTEEAAEHTGGNSGKGGDLLYRWGNPQAYRTGNEDDQKLFSQHDAQWITQGCPGEGNILVFNNGPGRPGPDYSSVDEIVPPVDEDGNYEFTPGLAYEPDEPVWSYTANNPTDFYAMYISGAERLTSGNTLICDGPAGRFFEVTPEKLTVWEYVNPYPSPLLNDVFKIDYLPSDEPTEDIPDLDCQGSLHWEKVKAGETINGSFQVKNIGDNGSLLNWKIQSFPDWGTWTFNPQSGKNLSPDDEPVNVQVSVIAPNKKNRAYNGVIRVENQEDSEDFDVIPVYLKNSRMIFNKRPFLDCLKNQEILFPLIKLLIRILEL